MSAEIALANTAAAAEDQRGALEAMTLQKGSRAARRNAENAKLALQQLQQQDAAAAPGASSIAAGSGPAGELYTHTARMESEEERSTRVEEHTAAMQQQARQRAEILSPDERASLAQQIASQLTHPLFDGGRTPSTHERGRLRAQDELCSNLALYHTVAPDAMRLIDEWFAQRPDEQPDSRRIAMHALFNSARASYQSASVAQQLDLDPALVAGLLEVLPR